MEELAPTLSNIKKIGRKDVETEPYAKYIIRPISVYFTWLFVRTPLTANNITFLQIIIGCIGSIALAIPDLFWCAPVYGVLLIQSSYILDCVDGEVARWKKIESKRGVFLDIVCHSIVISLYMFCFGYGLWTSGFSYAILLGAGASFCSFKIDEYAYIKVSNIDHGTGSIYKSGIIKLLAFYRFPASMNYLTLAVLFDYYMYGGYAIGSYILLVAFCSVITLGRVVQIINICPFVFLRFCHLVCEISIIIRPNTLPF